MRLIISDTHLHKPEDENYQRLVRLLDSQRERVSHLYILGDLFEFWFNYGNVIFRDDLLILSSLMQYKKASIPITYIVGNHDYELGPVFTETLNTRELKDSIDENWNGKAIHLAHGDLANPKDYGYRFLRFILRSKFGLAIHRLIPARCLRGIAYAMSNTSKYVREPSKQLVAAQKTYAAEQIKKGSHLVIQGHSHQPWLEKVQAGEHKGISANVGDGLKHYTCLIANNGKIAQYSYKQEALELLNELEL